MKINLTKKNTKRIKPNPLCNGGKGLVFVHFWRQCRQLDRPRWVQQLTPSKLHWLSSTLLSDSPEVLPCMHCSCSRVDSGHYSTSSNQGLPLDSQDLSTIWGSHNCIRKHLEVCSILTVIRHYWIKNMSFIF